MFWLLIFVLMIAFLWVSADDAKKRDKKPGKQIHLVRFQRLNGRMCTIEIPMEKWVDLRALVRDEPTAVRLIADAVETYKWGKGRWIVEKVIHDLERDRR